MISITEDEFKELADDYMGVCLECHEYQDNTEPDARNYTCENCGQDKVFGLEEALLMNEIDIE
jgi:hypothetical protein